MILRLNLVQFGQSPLVSPYTERLKSIVLPHPVAFIDVDYIQQLGTGQDNAINCQIQDARTYQYLSRTHLLCNPSI